MWEAWNMSVLVLVVVVYVLLQLTGVVLTALQLPGTWLMLLVSAGFAWWRWNEPNPSLGWWALAVLLGLALLGELLEFATSAIGSKSAGGSKRGAGLSIVMAIPGAILFTFLLPIPIVGTLIGAAVGAGVGSMLGDRWAGREWEETLAGAKGAVLGKLTGAAAKIAVAAAMFVVACGALAL